jgi:hypothetical protein
MTKFAIDLSKVQDIKPLPAGVYAVRIVEIDATKKSKTGNDKLVIKTEIIAPASVAATQKNWWFSLSLVESALFRTKQLFEKANVPIRAGGFDTADLIGREVGVVVNLEETKEYGIRNQIVNFLPIKETKPEVKVS